MTSKVRNYFMCKHGVLRSVWCRSCSEINWKALRAARATQFPELNQPIIDRVVDKVMEELTNGNG